MNSVNDYDYTYPDHLAAQAPPEQRGSSRMLVVPRDGAALTDSRVGELSAWLRPGDLLVVNDAWVEAAKLVAIRSTGGRVRVLVVHADGPRGTVLLGARGKLAVGEELAVGDTRWRIVEALGEGRFSVEDVAGNELRTTLDRDGRMPLPPYITRDPVRDERDAFDRTRYQTSFAARDENVSFGAVAAPTAGLHFTPQQLDAVRAAGVEIAPVRLDVGEGTFRPMRSEAIDDHEMHRETYHVSQETAEAFAAARARGGRVVAVGTTVVRTLESAVNDEGTQLAHGDGATRLFIRPGFTFRAADALMTNFHQPRSTLLVLVSAFCSRDIILAAYDHAIANDYRLFSYGDAMLLV